MSEKDYESMSASEKKKEDWMNSKWRPMMGWIYMGTCICDFVLFPVLWSLLQATMKIPVTQWQPLTLQGAGLYHIAMGAVLGLAAWGRTQEKLNGAHTGGLAPVSQSVTTTFGSPSTGGFGSAPTSGSFGGGGFGSTPAPTRSFNTAPAAVATGAAVGFGAAQAVPMMDKPMPSRPPMEENFSEIN